jgi:hypothetical protein
MAISMAASANQQAWPAIFENGVIIINNENNENNLGSQRSQK